MYQYVSVHTQLRLLSHFKLCSEPPINYNPRVWINTDFVFNCKDLWFNLACVHANNTTQKNNNKKEEKNGNERHKIPLRTQNRKTLLAIVAGCAMTRQDTQIVVRTFFSS